ncbi:MAG: tetratricopeptide repeat protein, partial [Bacteroidales bacterium]|nr:tetratricopeptide repeat protein [Bacteroidales bacterium]
LRKLGFTDLLSLFGAAIYSVHPLFSFAISWIPARGDLLLAMFGIIALIFYLRYTERKRAVDLILYFVAFMFAVMAKESAFMIAFITAGYSLFIKKDFKINKALFIQAAFYLLVAVVYFYMRRASVSTMSDGAFGLSRFLTNLPVVPETLLKFFVPLNIVVLPFYDTVRTVSGIILIFLFMVLLWRAKLNIPLTIWASLFFIFLTLPAMFYNPGWSDYIYQYLLHRAYFPMMGILILLLMLIAPLEEYLAARQFRWGMIIIIAAFTLMSIRMSGHFSGPVSFWRYAVKTNPSSAFSHLYLGNVSLMEGDYATALDSYNRALAIKTDMQKAVINRGVVFMQMSNTERAIEDFSRSLSLDSTDIKALRYRADALLKQKDYRKAAVDFNTLIRKGEKTKEYVYSRGLCYMFLGTYHDAFNDFTHLINRHPENRSITRLYAVSAMLIGNPQEAVAKNRWLIERDSTDFSALCNLGYALWENEEYAEAEKAFIKAEEIKPGYIDVTLGMVLCSHTMNHAAALQDYRNKALQMEPRLIGEEGITVLEDEGYLFSKRQKQVLNEVF